MDESEARDVIATALGRVAPEIDVADIDPSSELQIEADLDSLDHLHLIEAVSTTVGRDIPEKDYPRTVTLEGFTDYLVGLTGS